MRRTDEPLDPEIREQLDAIDATLAGDPVDPEYAELAELALLLRADRPRVPDALASTLDERVRNRFMAPPAAKRPRRWFAPLAGLSAAAVAAAVAVVVLSSGGGVSSSGLSSTTAAPSARLGQSSSSSGSTSVQSAPSAASGRARAAAAGTPALSAMPASQAPQPPANGRKVVQSAQLQLNAQPTRIEDVSQQVFDVVGREKGVVKNSTVTAGGAAGTPSSSSASPAPTSVPR